MTVFISCDIETNGPIPNPNSMLQLGAAAFDRSGELISTYQVNLEELPGGERCEKTMKWWAEQGDLFEKTRQNMVPPEKAMLEFCNWVEETCRGRGKPVFAGYPVAWDFSFVFWYLIRFVGRSPFSHSALDIKTLAAVALDKELDYRQVSKSSMPRDWFSESLHTHVAVDDAVEQGELMFKIFEAIRERRS